VTVEIGSETVPMHARVAETEERNRIWAQQKQDFPGFAEYEASAGRQIPVVIISR